MNWQRFFLVEDIVGWEQERPISVRRVSTSHLGSKLTHRAPEMGHSYPRWDVLTRRAEIGRSYAPSGERMFLLPPDDILYSNTFLTIFVLKIEKTILD